MISIFHLLYKFEEKAINTKLYRWCFVLRTPRCHNHFHICVEYWSHIDSRYSLSPFPLLVPTYIYIVIYHIEKLWHYKSRYKPNILSNQDVLLSNLNYLPDMWWVYQQHKTPWEKSSREMRTRKTYISMDSEMSAKYYI